MIIPSIDLIGGNAVQLIGGKEKAIDAGDPRPIAKNFSVAGEIAVIDLDAALSQGSNEQTIKDLLRIAPCRVGGGIRDYETAVRWLDAGAQWIIIGTKAQPELLSRLPRERVIAALDAYDGEVVIEGWQTKTGRGIVERMAELRDYVGGFLVTFVEREGRMQGTNLDKVAELVEAAGSARLTIAGGVSTTEDIRTLDALGADAQVGMALYSGSMDLGDAIWAPVSSEREDGLVPTVVSDENGLALGLVWSSNESLRRAVATGNGVYHSRKRGIWAKGETSGATQELIRITPDCDRDALRFVVTQAEPGFCHENTRSCWGDDQGIAALYRLLCSRIEKAPESSYSKRLFEDPELLNAKILEEAQELCEAKSQDQVRGEAADLLYFTLSKMVSAGVSLKDVELELTLRNLKVTRRSGDAKV